MAPNSKNKKKKAKAKHIKKNHTGSTNGVVVGSNEINAEVFDPTEEYPTSRVIKSAPNGDVIVESLTTNNVNGETERNKHLETSSMATVLDNHWETLSPEVKKHILRIDKNEVLDVIQKYQSNHNCNCSVCGRRHMAMDQEMERIYNTLYEIDKVKDPEINPVKFHLGIIQELQLSKQNQTLSGEDDNHRSIASPSGIQQKDNEIKHFLPSNNVESLKEEVMNFKQRKQLIDDDLSNQNNKGQLNQNSAHNIDENDDTDIDIHSENNSIVSNENLDKQYRDFTKKFISSHPKLANEYVNKMMLYPEMLNVTNSMMGIGSDKNFIESMTDFVAQKLKDGAENLNKDGLGDPKVFTTMLHNGTPLTPEEYIELQRNIADRMTNSYDTKKREFSSISPLEKELFVRFMLSDNRKEFEDIVMQSFREKFDYEFGGSSISASLAAAAAAATLTNPLAALSSHNNSHNSGTKFQNFEQENDISDDEYDYSEYDDEEEEDNDGDDDAYDDDQHEGNEVLSDYLEDEDHSRPEYSEHAHYDANQHMMAHQQEHVNYLHHPHNGIGTHDYVGSDEFDEDRDIYDEDEEEDLDDEGEDDLDDDDGYESPIDEAGRLEEGRKLLQIAITKLLQGRILESYHETEAENNRLKLLQELEDEQKSKENKKQKKQKKKEKEKEKKKQQQLAKEEAQRKKIEEEERIKKEKETRELERREAQRKKVEEAKKKKDEERRRKLEEQRKREEQQEHQRKAKEEQKRKRDEEKKKKEDEKKRLKEQKQAEADAEAQTQSQVPIEDTTEIQQNLSPVGRADHSPSKTPKEETKPKRSTEFEKPENVNDDITNMISAATASYPMSTSPSHLQNLLKPQIPNVSTPVANMSNNIMDQSLSQLPIDTNTLFPAANSLLSTPVLPASRQNENSALYSSLSNNPPSGLSGLSNGAIETPLWNSYSTPNISHNLSNPILPNDPITYHSATGTPQSRLASYNPINASNQPKQSFADELNSLTNMLSYSGLHDANFTTSTSDQMWNNSQRNSVSSPMIGQQLNGMPVTGGQLHNSVPPSTLHPFMDSHPPRSGSIWNNSTTDRTNHTPLNNSGTPSLMVGGSTLNRQLQEQSNDVSNLLPSSIWSEPTPSFANPTNNLAMNISPLNNEFKSEQSSIPDMIYKECKNLQQLDHTQQPYIPVDALFHRMSFLGLDYNTLLNIVVSMKGKYDIDTISNGNGIITHIVLNSNSATKNNVMNTPASMPDINPMNSHETAGLNNGSFNLNSSNDTMESRHIPFPPGSLLHNSISSSGILP
ncbi:Stress response protein nst1 [Maudiozyma exigua]|uniref:Multifunctional fusion protein n=1 Tax=Maudiozyma exigua TaxID=34358 RepID=A0A9P6WDL1_MAUEX|nr:Stress response protein nst1 [Kazachstania exigua]